SPGGAAGRGAADRTAPYRPVAPGPWSGAEHAGDGLRGFLDLGVDLVAALDGRVGDAEAQELLEQLQGEGLQGLGGAGQPGEHDGGGLGGLRDLGGVVVTALDGRVGDAVAQVLLQQLQGEGLQGLGGGGHLGEYVDAVDVLVDHALQAADLSLDAAQAFEVFL